MEDFWVSLAAGVIALTIIFVPVWFSMGFRVEAGEQNVSGIAYKVKNNVWPMGSTSFSVRASENTYVSGENKSSYCLPTGSEYIELVNKAAKDKSVKLSVTTEKIFYWTPNPLECADNVKVEEIK